MELPGEKLAVKILELAGNVLGGWLKGQDIKRTHAAHVEAYCEGVRKIVSLRQELQDFQGKEASTGNLELASVIDILGRELVRGLSSGGEVSERQQLAANLLVNFFRNEFGQTVKIAQVVQSSLEAAKYTPDEEVADGPVDPDWFTQFRKRAGDVSNETMQRLWGHILAGEVKQPGSYSLHTMALLGRLSQEDAKLIATASALKIENFIFRGSTNQMGFLDQFGLNFEQCLTLSHLGIIHSVDPTGVSLIWKIEKQGHSVLFDHHNRAVKVTGTEKCITFRVSAYPLTPIGKELCSLGSFSANEKYLREFAQALKAEGVTVEVGNKRPISVFPGTFDAFDLVEI